MKATQSAWTSATSTQVLFVYQYRNNSSYMLSLLCISEGIVFFSFSNELMETGSVSPSGGPAIPSLM
jgi:hypothetical protein